MPEPATGRMRGLVVDWGGVLTGDLHTAVSAWAAEEQVDMAAYIAVMRDWLGTPVAREARFNPVHALERGELEVPDFERRLAEALTERTGTPHVADGLVTRMLAKFENAHDMSGLVRRARRAGIATALLSNSWGDSYPRDGWEEMFDVVVISGEVGLRKPEPEIYHLTLDRLGLPASQCVFVDDLPHNVAAAVDLGFVGIRHQAYGPTALELEAIFGLPLS